MDTFLFAFWFFLPAGLANASPVFFNKIPFISRWNTPLDFGLIRGGKRLFGDNKKWRGLIGGILVAALTVYLQYKLARSSVTGVGLVISQLSDKVNYFDSRILWLGPLLGFGALAGDAIESFFKRRVGVKAGESWFPFDQTDYIVGGLLASLLVVRLSLAQYLAIFIIYFGLHLISSYVGYLLKLKQKPI